jgi:hypothetical protein
MPVSLPDAMPSFKMGGMPEPIVVIPPDGLVESGPGDFIHVDPLVASEGLPG